MPRAEICRCGQFVVLNRSGAGLLEANSRLSIQGVGLPSGGDHRGIAALHALFKRRGVMAGAIIGRIIRSRKKPVLSRCGSSEQTQANNTTCDEGERFHGHFLAHVTLMVRLFGKGRAAAFDAGRVSVRKMFMPKDLWCFKRVKIVPIPAPKTGLESQF